ncbi:hypothetical protein HK100_012431 [Physocladia obscura]|uniref:Uncharacterized protein n=1 Tax=Physocladia obscura TaxID=109957 RepID=A0AAD5T0Q8_9FUNG|nr:hypothetical protein HK100_012431 [Physocladia obscura]
MPCFLCVQSKEKHQQSAAKIVADVAFSEPEVPDNKTVQLDVLPLPPITEMNAKTMSKEQLKTALSAFDGNLASIKRVERFEFFALKDFQSPFEDVVARELYRRNIIANKGEFTRNGTLRKLPSKKKHWEAVIRYIGTLIDPAKMWTQVDVLEIIKYFLPKSKEGGMNQISHTVLVTNLVAMNILEREMGGHGMWRTVGKGHPMPLGKGILPNF